MKNKRITILLIITNIILIGIICSLISKNGNIIKEKQIIKEMNESTEITNLNNQITELNKAHTNYANYIEESKMKIANAITDMGVETSSDVTLETMANNIRSISTNKDTSTFLAYYAWNYGSENMGTNNAFKIPLNFFNESVLTGDTTTGEIVAKESLKIKSYITGYERNGGATVRIYKNKNLINTYSLGSGAVGTAMNDIELNADDTLYFTFQNSTSNVTSFSIVLYKE